jgi:sugar lactone lactonase YvrE
MSRALAIAVVLAGCSNPVPCRECSLLVTVDLSGASTQADTLYVEVNRNALSHNYLSGTGPHTPGRAHGTLELDLPCNLSEADTTVTISAVVNGQVVGRGTAMTTFSTNGGACLMFSISVSSSPPDMASPDASAPDLSIPDGSMPDASLDLSKPDASKPDASKPDLASTDLTPFCALTSVTTLAGNGAFGFIDGTGSPDGSAEFKNPTGLALDPVGNLVLADATNNCIRTVLAATGETHTLADTLGVSGFADGTASQAQFDSPAYVTVDHLGNVYVGDAVNNRVRKIDSSGNTSTFAGNGSVGFVDGTGGVDGGAEFNTPHGVAVDPAGNVYVADYNNASIRKIAPNGATTTLAGNGTPGFFDGTGGPSGTTRFDHPHALAIDTSGNLYVGDDFNHRIRKVAPDGTTTTLAGNGSQGEVDGTGGPSGTAEFDIPTALAVDPSGVVYVSDEGMGPRIAMITPDGFTTTLSSGLTTGFRDGPGCTAKFVDLEGLAVRGKQLFISDSTNNRIRVIQLP